MQVNLFVTTWISMIIWDIVPNLTIIWYVNSNYAEITIMTLEMQNYHFTPEGNMLDLNSKNYYEITFMWISCIRNLFHNLTNIYS